MSKLNGGMFAFTSSDSPYYFTPLFPDASLQASAHLDVTASSPSDDEIISQFVTSLTAFFHSILHLQKCFTTPDAAYASPNGNASNCSVPLHRSAQTLKTSNTLEDSKLLQRAAAVEVEHQLSLTNKNHLKVSEGVKETPISPLKHVAADLDSSEAIPPIEKESASLDTKKTHDLVGSVEAVHSVSLSEIVQDALTVENCSVGMNSVVASISDGVDSPDASCNAVTKNGAAGTHKRMEVTAGGTSNVKSNQNNASYEILVTTSKSSISTYQSKIDRAMGREEVADSASSRLNGNSDYESINTNAGYLTVNAANTRSVSSEDAFMPIDGAGSSLKSKYSLLFNSLPPPLQFLKDYRNFLHCFKDIVNHKNGSHLLLKLMQIMFSDFEKYGVYQVPLYSIFLTVCLYIPGDEKDEFLELLISWWTAAKADVPVVRTNLSHPSKSSASILTSYGNAFEADPMSGKNDRYQKLAEARQNCLQSFIASLLPVFCWVYVSRTLLPAHCLHECHYYLNCCELVEAKMASKASFREEEAMSCLQQIWESLQSPQTEDLPDNYLGIEKLLNHFALIYSKNVKQRFKVFSIEHFHSPYHNNPLLKELLIRGSNYVRKLHTGYIHPLHSEREILSGFSKHKDTTEHLFMEALQSNIAVEADNNKKDAMEEQDNDEQFISNEYFVNMAATKLQSTTSKTQLEIIIQCIGLFHKYIDVLFQSVRFLDEFGGPYNQEVENAKVIVGMIFAKVSKSFLAVSFEPVQPACLLNGEIVTDGSFTRRCSVAKEHFDSTGDARAMKSLKSVLGQHFSVSREDGYLMKDESIEPQAFMLTLGSLQLRIPTNIYELETLEIDPWKTGSVRLNFDEPQMLVLGRTIGLLGTRLHGNYKAHKRRNRREASSNALCKSEPRQSNSGRQNTLQYEIKVLLPWNLQESLSELQRSAGEGLLRSELQAMPRAYWSFKIIEGAIA